MINSINPFLPLITPSPFFLSCFYSKNSYHKHVLNISREIMCVGVSVGECQVTRRNVKKHCPQTRATHVILSPGAITNFDKIILEIKIQPSLAGWASPRKARVHEFDCRLGHMSTQRAWSPDGCMGGSGSMSLSHIGVSLPLFNPPFSSL